MPYKLEEANGGWYVVNEDNGKRKNKTPISKERAVKYMRALYAAESGTEMHGKEIAAHVLTAFKRNFDPNTGGGVDRDKLAASDFVDPERRRFPIVKPGDIMDAVHSYGRAKPPIPFEEFKRRVIAIAKRKGFVSSLPKDWKVEEKEVAEKGGEGSGNFGHSGRPGEVGGSSSDGGSNGGNNGGRISDNGGGNADKRTISKLSKGLSSAKQEANDAFDNDEINRGLHSYINNLSIPSNLTNYEALGIERLLENRGSNSFASQVRQFAELPYKSGDDIQEKTLIYIAGARALTNKEYSAKEASPALMVYKDATGADRWVLFSSNAYQDRDKEIVSTAALEADVARTDKEQNYGPLRWWHVGKPDPIAQLPGPGADLGACDFRALHGRMLVESGTFNNPKVAAAVKEIAPLLQVSLGFFHPRTEPDKAGVFHSIKTFERSILPAGRASNQFTAIPAVKTLDGGETVLKEKFQALKALLNGDEELANSIIAMAEAKEKEAQDQGIAFKGDEPEAEAVMDAPIETVDEGEIEGETELADEPEPEYEPTIGDLSPAQFTDLLAKVVDTAMEPHRKELSDLQASMKLKDDSESALRESLASQAQTIATLKSQLDELTGSQPRAATKGYRASQDADTVVKDDSRVKGKQPTVDPDFIKMFTP